MNLKKYYGIFIEKYIKTKYIIYLTYNTYKLNFKLFLLLL